MCVTEKGQCCSYIPKTNPPRNIESDLRPISSTSTLSKVLESIVGGWILEFVRDKVDKQQLGAIKGRSTTHALFDILHYWHQALDHSDSVRVMFIDYAKAFDHANHSTLVRKLYNFNVPQFLIRWSCSFLTNRMQRVKLSEYLSEWLTLKGSMPQGTWLGPLVFILLINDLSSGCTMHTFVDDVTLSEVISKHDNSNMYAYFNDVVEWSDHNLMTINVAQTKEMLERRINKEPPPNIFICSNVIERVCSFRLLGIHIDNNLKWSSHTTYIYSKASSRLYFLKLFKRSGACIDDMLLSVKQLFVLY
jgi:Reverse transcriptase (RNA-dependent DNA polymerase)